MPFKIKQKTTANSNKAIKCPSRTFRSSSTKITKTKTSIFACKYSLNSNCSLQILLRLCILSKNTKKITLVLKYYAIKQLFGLDFMITDEFQPLLIEVNMNPCLETSCNLLNRLIPNLVE